MRQRQALHTASEIHQQSWLWRRLTQRLHQLHYLHPTWRTLLVSYGRSDNSPENLAAVILADHVLPDCHHLVITCNAEGELARFGQNRQRTCTLLMPRKRWIRVSP